MYRIVGLYREQREHTKKLIDKRAVCAKSSKIRSSSLGSSLSRMFANPAYVK